MNKLHYLTFELSCPVPPHRTVKIDFPYTLKSDEEPFFFPFNGCDDSNGSHECIECKRSINKFLLRTDITFEEVNSRFA